MPCEQCTGTAHHDGSGLGGVRLTATLPRGACCVVRLSVMARGARHDLWMAFRTLTLTLLPHVLHGSAAMSLILTPRFGDFSLFVMDAVLGCCSAARQGSLRDHSRKMRVARIRIGKVCASVHSKAITPIQHVPSTFTTCIRTDQFCTVLKQNVENGACSTCGGHESGRCHPQHRPQSFSARVPDATPLGRATSAREHCLLQHTDRDAQSLLLWHAFRPRLMQRTPLRGRTLTH